MRNWSYILLFATVCGCAGLMKDDTYNLNRANESSFKPECVNPGKEGDLIKIDGIPFYFQPVRKLTFIGPPLLPLFPLLYTGLVKKEIKLVLAPGWSANSGKWKIRLKDSKGWREGSTGDSRLGEYVSFKVEEFPDDFELQYIGESPQSTYSAQFARSGNWTYRPVLGLEGEQLRGWLPSCAR